MNKADWEEDNDAVMKDFEGSTGKDIHLFFAFLLQFPPPAIFLFLILFRFHFRFSQSCRHFPIF